MTRVMPLLSGAGDIDQCAVGIIQAHMIFPDDQASIDDDVDAYRIRQAKGFPKSHLGDRLNEDFRSAQIGGYYAGAVLYNILLFRGPPAGTVNKGVFLAALEAHEERHPTEKNKDTIRKFWAHYKNSAPLWAAMMLVYREAEARLPLDFVSLATLANQMVSHPAAAALDWNPWAAPANFPFDCSRLEIPAPDAQDIARMERYSVGAK